MKRVSQKQAKINLKKELGARIREIRKASGLTQEDLAERMETHSSFVGAIESGIKFPRAETFLKISKALDVPLYQLWMFESDIPRKNRAIQELLDLINDSDRDVDFLASVAKEARKRYGRS